MPNAEASSQAWVTLATNDSYALGALVLANSLKRSGTTRKIVIMVTAEGLSAPMRAQLANAFDEVVDVSLMDSKDKVNLALLERPELGVTFTKLHCWCLVQYSKCVFLDADTLVVKNSDELFERSEFSAAPDAGWPDCFNSGVFVFSPSKETFAKLMEHAATEGSFDGGDQGLLNTFFSTWSSQDISKHLPFLYNMCATATYTYLPAFKRYGQNVKIVHFIGTSKPWHVKFDSHGQPQPQLYEEHTAQFLKHWWHIFHTDVKPSLTKVVESVVEVVGQDVSAALAFTDLSLGASGSGVPDQSVSQDRSRWEEGNPDFRGAHSFDNILKKIDSTMSSPNSDRSRSPDIADWPSRGLAATPLIHGVNTYLEQVDDTQANDIDDRQRWEQGHPDFKGVHAFDNILVKLQESCCNNDHDIIQEPQYFPNPDSHSPNNYDRNHDHEEDIIQSSYPEPPLSFPAPVISFDLVLQRITASLAEKPSQMTISAPDHEEPKQKDQAVQVSLPFPARTLEEKIFCPTCGQPAPPEWTPKQRKRFLRHCQKRELYAA